jgi:iron(III) transport system substrate-binding protein
MRQRRPSRRDILKGSGALALGTVFAAPARAAAPPAEWVPGPMLRIAPE